MTQEDLLQSIFDPARSIWISIPTDTPTPSEDLALYMAKASYRTLATVSDRAFVKDKTLYYQLQIELHVRRQDCIKNQIRR